MEKKWTKKQIKARLMVNNDWVERGIVAIYNKQTEEEKEIEDTFKLNGVGFSSAHVRLGSYLARWILKGNHLSGTFIEKGRSLILHYTDQLTNIANAN